MWRADMKTSYDVVVVGGGPAGSVAAWHAAMGGAKVLLLEKDRDIGPPVRCAEGVGASGLRLVIEPREHFIENRIEGVNLFAPNGRKVHMETDDIGFVLNRKVFDRYLAELAAKAGAEIRTKAYVDGLLVEDGQVHGVTFESMNRRFEVRASIVIGADGVESRVGRWAGIRTQLKLKDLETCVQYTMANVDVDARYCNFYFSRAIAPGGYLWVFPKGDGIANVGLGISGADAKNGVSPRQYLERFVAEHFPGASILTTSIGGVPVARTLREIVKPGLMLVGDAARQANPVSGGGIVSGMIAGKLAGQVAAEAV
ncbi:MAG TPA: NAD(P)/FAD-dependent oxidoreductase, partial [Bacteroidetes bacterium]|nr:NAD(P)/FAD-dependent oxidoreductase [Bacteroidota bacterium]